MRKNNIKNFPKTYKNKIAKSLIYSECARIATELSTKFNYEIKNKKLKNIEVDITGNWVKVYITKAQESKLDSRSKLQLQRILNSNKIRGAKYKWDRFENFYAQGPGTRNGKRRWNASKTYQSIKFF